MTETIARFNHKLCSLLGFPQWVLDNDRVLHHHTRSEQTVKELTCSLAVHATATVIMTTVVDYCFARPFTRLIQKNVKPWYTEVKRTQPLVASASSSSSPTSASPASPVASPLSQVHSEAKGENQKEKRVKRQDDTDSDSEVEQQQQQQQSKKNFPETEKKGEEGFMSKVKAFLIDWQTHPSRKTSWFLLHAIFNGVIGIISIPEARRILSDPAKNTHLLYEGASHSSPPGAKYFNGSAPGGLLGAIMIGAYHFQHTLCYSDLLTGEDIIHHGVNAGAVVLVGVYCPWGNMTSLSNWAMCAVPGKLSYLSLYLQKLGFITRLGYKKFNRYMNILLRYPVQLLAHYIGTRALLLQEYPKSTLLTRLAMLFGGWAHTLNALYYCDIVVGTYYLEEESVKQRNKLEKEAAAATATAAAASAEGVPTLAPAPVPAPAPGTAEAAKK